MTRPPPDPRELRHFPQPQPPIGPGRPELHRIYRHRDPATGRVRAPFFFASAPAAGGGRYDLPAPDGACYTALSAVGAWLEVFRTTAIVAAEDLRTRRLLRTRPPRRIQTADLLSPRARSLGITGEIHTTSDYTLTRRWASQLHRAGFRAVLGKVRHDPALRQRSLTLFDAAGEHGPYGWRWRTSVEDLRTDRDLLNEVAAYGFRILERPVDVDTDDLEA